jgi:hypothetical protein
MSNHETTKTDDIRDEEPRVSGWSLKRLVVAAMLTIIAGLVAAGIWGVGQAQFLEDYCSTQAPQPKAPSPEALDGRPAYLDGLVTVRCEYDDLPTVVVTEPLPLVGALVLAALVLWVAFAAFRWARRPAAG